MSVLSIAVSGIGYGALAVALSGFAGGVPSTVDLTVSPAAQANTAGTGAVSQTHVLGIASANQGNSPSSPAVTQVQPLTVSGLTQGNAASSVAVASYGDIAVSSPVQANTLSTGRVTTTQTLTIASAEQDNRLTGGALRADIVFEEALATVKTQAGKIKKPGIPNDAPQWLKTTLETLMGRRNNKIEIPKAQSLTFSSTPTKAECEALFSHVSEVRSALEQLINRQDS